MDTHQNFCQYFLQIQSWDIFDVIGDIQKVLQNKLKPNQCPQCRLIFKYDIALLRHERKTGHINLRRQQRRKRRYPANQPQQHVCTCALAFANRLDLQKHQQFCEKNNQKQSQTTQLSSNWTQQPYICSSPQTPCYPSTNNKQAQALFSIQTKQAVGRGKLTEEGKIQLFRQFAKYRKLNDTAAERIARSQGLSTATIKKHFYKFKKQNSKRL